MQESELEIERLSRQRVRTALRMVLSFAVVLAAIAANDELVRDGRALSAIRMGVLAVLATGGLGCS